MAEQPSRSLVQALAMHRRIVPGDSTAQAIVLDRLGTARQKLGRLEEGEALLAEALAMRRRLYKGDDRDLAIGLNNLAYARFRLRRHAEAEALANESLNMFCGSTRLTAPRWPEL